MLGLSVLLQTRHILFLDIWHIYLSLYLFWYLSIYLPHLSSSWIPSCTRCRPCTDLPVEGGKQKQISSMGITHVSISVSTVLVLLSVCLSVSVYLSDWLNLHLIHLLLPSFFKRKLMQTADYFLLCTVVSFAHVTFTLLFSVCTVQ